MHPDLPSSEALDYVVPLSLGPLRVDDIHVQPIIYQLLEQLLGPLDALHKHQHGRLEPLVGRAVVTNQPPLKPV